MKKVFSLLTMASLVASQFYGAKNQKNPCDEIENGMSIPSSNTCYPGIYNQHANVIMDNAIDFTGQVSFLYWYVAQSNMKYGTKNGTDGLYTTQRSLYPEFNFQPGFKLGLAMDTKYDDWKMFANYTYMHQTTSHTANGSDLALINTTSSQMGHSSWKMNMDMVDVGFNRAFYQSKRISISPVAAFRLLLLRENFRLTPDYSYPADAYKYSRSHNAKFYSWAMGPTAGANMNFLFDHGFRFEGKASGAICYTRYSDIKAHTYGYNYLTGTNVETKVTNPNFNAIRPMLELGMGLGWGTYTAARDYYFDLSLRYDFNVLWSQNQLILKSEIPEQGGAVEDSRRSPYAFDNGNLTMQGLTVTGRIDF